MSQTTTWQGANKGLWLALGLAVAFVPLHLYSVFAVDVAAQPILTLALLLVQTWLFVGLFIVAHDAIHETLFGRGNPWNDRVGMLIHFLYAGFSFREMKAAHIDHHDYPGTERDPDFHASDPRAFWPWYWAFFTRYFGLRQFATLAVFSAIYLMLGAEMVNLVVLWAVPSILSSLQLFYFGTYLTHRHAEEFPDHHNARSNDMPGWLSLLTCFHFGYHHEHHLYPHEPWWRLPARRAERSS